MTTKSHIKFERYSPKIRAKAFEMFDKKMTTLEISKELGVNRHTLFSWFKVTRQNLKEKSLPSIPSIQIPEEISIDPKRVENSIVFRDLQLQIKNLEAENKDLRKHLLDILIHFAKDIIKK